MDDNSVYRDLFFEETDENLAILNDEVLRLEQTPDDTHIIDAIFRAAHTLKGMAATMGYTTMATLTHAVESVFERVKSDQLTVTTPLISLIFESLDTLTQLVEDLRAEGDESLDISHLVQRLEHTGDTDAKQTTNVHTADGFIFPELEEADYSVINTAEASGYTCFSVGVQIEKDSPMKAARAFMFLSKLEQVGDILQMKPDAQTMEQGDVEERFTLYFLSKETQETIEQHVAGVSEIVDVEVTPQTLDELKRMDEHDVSQASAAPEPSADKQPDTKKPVPKRPAAKQTIRVDLSRLDQFMNLVSELVIHRTRLEDISEKNELAELGEPLTQVGRLTTELQELVLQLRMQPFSVVVQRFPRMMRDLSNELGKDIQFLTEGEDTELDRTVISEIGEPLIHLLRNATDHGIELPDEREKAGKPRTGTIKLSAYQEGNRVIVTLTDDGKGLNPRLIEKSAEKKGISTEGLTDKEIQELIFHPGFSTAETVTGISGRGVGMDAVKAKIGELNGKIETVSEVGKGSTFIITLPLTLSIIQSLLVKVSGETFAIPQAVIDKIEKYEQSNVRAVHQKEVYRFDGQTLPVIRLADALDLDAATDAQQHVIIVLIGQMRYALVVDELVHQKEIVIKKLGRELDGLSYFLGATILGDGHIRLILDVTAICTRQTHKQRD